MARRSVAAAALAVCAAVVAAQEPAPPAAPAFVADRPTEPGVPTVAPGLWVVMGSSSALGVGAPVGRGWVSLLQAQMHDHGVSLINLAKGGISSYAGVGTRLPPLVMGRPPADPEINIDTAISLQPSFLIISYPSNDTASGYAVEETVGNILAIRKQAQQKRIPVMVLSSQPRRLPAEQQARLTRIDEQLREAFGPCFVDIYGALVGPNGGYQQQVDSGDGIHPNSLGHARIYDQVRRALDEQRCVRIGANDARKGP